jgi:hypothetical protein
MAIIRATAGRPLLGWIQVAAPIGLADDDAEAPFQHRIAVMPQLIRAVIGSGFTSLRETRRQ